jgi:hypothetical protein
MSLEQLVLCLLQRLVSALRVLCALRAVVRACVVCDKGHTFSSSFQAVRRTWQAMFSASTEVWYTTKASEMWKARYDATADATSGFSPS